MSSVCLRSKVILQAAGKAGISATSLSCIINVYIVIDVFNILCWINFDKSDARVCPALSMSLLYESVKLYVFDILYWINIDTKVKKKRFAFPFSAETVPALEGRDF